MNKQIKTYLLIFLFFIVVSLSGCEQNTSDATNIYRLPLGDSGYISDMDFKLDNNKIIYTTDEEGVSIASDAVSYSYVTEAGTYVVSVTARAAQSDDQNTNGKHFKLAAGYYNDEGDFVVYKNSETNNNEGKVFTLSNNATPITYTYSFVVDNVKAGSVVKISFGTQVDEEVFKADGQGKVSQRLKPYKGSSIILTSFTINEDSATEYDQLLFETTQSGKIVAKQDADLFYFNTATAYWETTIRTLTLKLNYKGGFWVWWQWVIYQLGALLNLLTKLVGGYYWIALTILTLLLRTAAWPIYAKTNNMTYKMQAIQPEIDKLNKKYEGKTDQNSKMKQQMETKALMKKNKVSMFGCLMPFAQMPIFIAVYQIVQRFPLTPAFASTSINFNFLWTTFAIDYGQTTGDWILAVLVGLTMIISQELTTYFTKKVQKKRKNFYSAKNQQSNTQMRIMMIVMTVMMVVFAWKSAGIAYYWIVGNSYQIFQTFISKTNEAKKEEAKQKASSKAWGRDNQ